MDTITGILFDKDGTLLDFEATWGPATAAVLGELAGGDANCLADLAQSAGYIMEEQSFSPDSPIIAGDLDSFAPAWAERLGRAYTAEFSAHVDALYRTASLKSLTAYDDVAPVLAAIAGRGIAIGLATNDSEASAHAHLSAMRVEHRFAFVAGFDSGFGAKPGPGMVAAFAERIGARPGETALVGDSEHDMLAARAAGARAIGIARTPAARQALEGRCDALVGSLDELAELFEINRSP